MTIGDFPPNPLEKPGYRLEFHDEFERDSLDPDKWIPYYLPQWSSRTQSAPRYTLQEHSLILQIEADQRPWCPEFDDDIRCSSIQTGVFAGPLGSTIGQHRFKPTCRVREAQTTQRTYTPLYGYFEARIKAVEGAADLVALWMIGFEETPEESGEIVIFEIFGDQITPTASEVRYGVKPWSDPGLSHEMVQEVLPFDASDFHIYAIEWMPTHIDFYIDNVKRRSIRQSPAYPMQFMLNIYEFPRQDTHPSQYPKQFMIDYFRGYQPTESYRVR